MVKEKTVAFQMRVEPEWLDKIDDYRFANRIPSRAEAIRRLVELGLAAKSEE